MKLAWIASFCVTACIGFLSGALAQQPAGGLITVPVQITDLEGRPVGGLQAKDFMIYENRIAQTIGAFTKGESEGEYIITYSPAPNPNAGYRPIDVRVALPNVRVSARPGYDPSENK